MNSNGQFPSAARLSIIVVGYLISIAGALSVFSAPLSVYFPALVAGCGVTALASRGGYSAPRFTWRTWPVWVAGSIVILGVLWLIGENKVRHWMPHPAGYQLVWLICFSMVRHLRHIFHKESSAPNAA